MVSTILSVLESLSTWSRNRKYSALASKKPVVESDGSRKLEKFVLLFPEDTKVLQDHGKVSHETSAN
jgi:hypothetical protein